VVNTLTLRNIQAVVVDIRQGRIDELLLDELRIYVPGLCADAGDPHILRTADIDKAVGIIAGTDDDANNLSILMTAKDLNPNIYTVVRQNRPCATSSPERTVPMATSGAGLPNNARA
jgi:Trk K+ transport system NAD-binding subunit